jgi:hypothetical protein
MNPYALMALLYIVLAGLAALTSALTGLQVLPFFNGLRWLRIHLITLGTLAQVIFGLTPLLVAARRAHGEAQRPRPALRWDIWLALNLGLLTLLVGIPLVNGALITAGAALIFVATGLLIGQLRGLGAGAPSLGGAAGRPFYLAGLSFLLLGITVGAGLWQSWLGALRINAPIEVHIHANSWGFAALVFAGLLVDLYPGFAGRPLAWPRSIRPIFWLITLGALGLVAGPWVPSTLLLVPGLILHLSGTLWLLLNVIVPLRGDRLLRTPGMLHLLTSYLWILAPVMIAPLVILKVAGFPGAGIEQNAPQALIYGWVLQFGYALLPYLFRRLFVPAEPARLGGSWLSLAAVHLGGIALWASIFLRSYQGTLQAAAYLLWLISLIPIGRDLFRSVAAGVAHPEGDAM